MPNFNDVDFVWNPSPSADVTGYKLYWGDAAGAYTNSVNAVLTNATLSLPTGSASFVAVTAVNSALESDLSNEVQVTP